VTPWTSNIETLFTESGDVNANLVLCQKPENGNHSKTKGLLPGDINALVEIHEPEYFRTCLVSDVPAGKQGSKTDVRAVLFFSIDLDANKPGHCSRANALEAVKSLKHQPTMIVSTKGNSGGFHLYWQFTEPVILSDDPDEQRAELELLQRRLDAIRDDLREALQKFECSEDSNGRQIYLDENQSVYRLLRVTGVRRTSGELVTIHESSETRYKPEDFEPKPKVKTPPSEYPSPTSTGDQDETPWDWFKKNKSWHDVLPEFGWKPAGENKWTRPGKKSGVSASIRLSKNGDELLRVHSSNAHPLECRSYNVWDAWVALKHNGDKSQAARAAKAMMPKRSSDMPKLQKAGGAKRVGQGSLENGRELQDSQSSQNEPGSENGSPGVQDDQVAQSNQETRKQRTDALLAYLETNPEHELTPDEETLLDDFLGEKYKTYPGGDFLAENFSVDWLVDRLLVQGQPCIVAGASKSLKTNVCIALATSLVSGKPFFGEFNVSRPRKVLFMSAESGEAAIQSSLGRIMAANQVERRSIEENLSVAPWVPHAKQGVKLAHFRRAIKKYQPEVVFIDPVYLATDGDDSANLQKMGQQFATLADMALGMGATPVFVHHTRKNALNVLERQPLEITDMQGAGVTEYFRQWMLLSRREKFNAASGGEHRLWMSGGGSAGHSYEFALDIHEKQRDGRPTGWVASLTDASEAMLEIEQKRKAAKEDKHNSRKQEAILAIVDCMKDGNVLARNSIERTDGVGRGKAGREAIEFLVSENILQEIECVRGQSGSIAEATSEDLAKKKATLIGYGFNAEMWARKASKLDEIDEPGSGDPAEDEVQNELDFE